MIYLKRKVDDFLLAWKEDSKRKPLIIRDSRQIGKTESVLCFASANYESVIEINYVPYFCAFLLKKYMKDFHPGEEQG